MLPSGAPRLRLQSPVSGCGGGVAPPDSARRGAEGGTRAPGMAMFGRTPPDFRFRILEGGRHASAEKTSLVSFAQAGEKEATVVHLYNNG